MTQLTYTDADLRTEAARQYSELHRDPDLLDAALEAGKEMRDTAIPSAVDSPHTEDGITWGHLPYDDLHDASREVRELLEDAPDLSQWAINLSASVLTRTTELAWGHGDNWHLAVQLAHRRGIHDDLSQAFTDAIRGAVNKVLADRGLDAPEIKQNDLKEATR